MTLWKIEGVVFSGEKPPGPDWKLLTKQEHKEWKENYDRQLRNERIALRREKAKRIKLQRLEEKRQAELAWQYSPEMMEYRRARNEHAWLLRAEGFSDKEIAPRLGLTADYVSDVIDAFGRKVEHAINYVVWPRTMFINRKKVNKP